MSEPVNLRTVRKRAQRRQDELHAAANRLAHGEPKHRRQYAAAKQAKADRDLEQHRIEKEDGR